MRARARLHDIGIDIKTRKAKVTFLLDDVPPQQLERLNTEDDLLVTVKKFSYKRSLDQNAYMWELLQAMADHVKGGSNKWEQYLRCIREYGVFAYYPAQEHDIPMLESVFRVVIDRGVTDLVTPSGKEVKVHQMQCFKGTSCYTKEELSNFLDKIIAECHDCGIDTATPDELAHIRSIQE